MVGHFIYIIVIRSGGREVRQRSAKPRSRVRFPTRPPKYLIIASQREIRGYRIAAIMRPCQGRNTGSTPVTRSIKKASTSVVAFFMEHESVNLLYFKMIVDIKRGDYFISF